MWDSKSSFHISLRYGFSWIPNKISVVLAISIKGFWVQFLVSGEDFVVFVLFMESRLKILEPKHSWFFCYEFIILVVCFMDSSGEFKVFQLWVNIRLFDSNMECMMYHSPLPYFGYIDYLLVLLSMTI